MRRMLIADAVIIATIIGVRTCPAPVADVPTTTRTYSGRNATNPNVAIPIVQATTVAARSNGTRNNENGKTGSLARASATTNVTNSTALSASAPAICGDPHP